MRLIGVNNAFILRIVGQNAAFSTTIRPRSNTPKEGGGGVNSVILSLSKDRLVLLSPAPTGLCRLRLSHNRRCFGFAQHDLLFRHSEELEESNPCASGASVDALRMRSVRRKGA